jgi:hypothetical protein
MLRNELQAKARPQRGYATLTMTIVILFLITLVVLYAGKTAVFEQDIAANQFRAAQALAASNAGLDYGLAYVAQEGIDHDGNDNADCNFDNKYTNTICTVTVSADIDFETDDGTTGTATQDVTFTFFFCNELATVGKSGEQIINNLADCGEADVSGLERVAVVAIGYSDDQAARRILVQGIQAPSLLAQGPQGPLNSRGTVSLIGNMTAINRYTNLSIWTGEPATAWGSASSFLRPKEFTLQTREACTAADKCGPDKKCRCYYDGTTWLTHAELVDDDTKNDYSDLTSDKKYGNNYDVITDDPNLREPQLTGDDLFEAIFNFDKEEFMAIADGKGQKYNGTAPPDGTKGEIWIEGDVSLNGGTYGTLEKPAAIVINGDLQSAGTLKIIGILYIIGEWKTAGQATIQGSAVVEGGGVDGAGTTKVIYDPVALENLNSPTRSNLLMGTWRDW